MEERKVCRCHDVSNIEIIDAIKKNNLDTVDEVGNITNAGTGCGFCQEEIEEILDDLKK